MPDILQRWLLILIVGAGLQAGPAAQGIERVTFDEAISRAVANNPRIQQAAADVLLAEGLLQQARGEMLPLLDATLTTNIIDPVTRFSGASINPRTQTLTGAGVFVPLITPLRWAERTQAADQVLVSLRAADDARRATAVATGEAYLAVIALRRVLELNETARDNARAHYDYANQRFEGGIGSRLNAVRAQQEWSNDETRVEAARLAVMRAQEALGVLMAANGPVDAATEPTFDLPPEAQAPVPVAGSLQPSSNADVVRRQDVQLVVQREFAAQRVFADSWKDYLPSVTALFAPQILAPAGLFANARSWRTGIIMVVPLFDFGRRQGRARERRAGVDFVRAERVGLERQASSEIRAAREAVLATERALAHANRAAQQANEVVMITDIVFREGATTNIELIDAQRRARDMETAVAVAEHEVRRARLELLVATGRFPQ